jgi:putative Mg2+ transporter-C (MgtC) family protein
MPASISWSDLGLYPPDGAQFLSLVFRLTVALFLGALVGLERQRRHHEAGLRTHMLVCLGSALFTAVPMEAGGTVNDLAQIVKGIAAGIGFLGAGTILKMTHEQEIRGLTTAASIWLTAGIGMAVGAGFVVLGSLGAVLGWIVLAVVKRGETSTVLGGHEDRTDG